MHDRRDERWDDMMKRTVRAFIDAFGRCPGPDVVGAMWDVLPQIFQDIYDGKEEAPHAE